MKLGEYLKKMGMTQQRAATESGVNQGGISRIIRGWDAKGLTWARIMHFTGGKVTPLDHFPIREDEESMPWPKKRKAAKRKTRKKARSKR